MNPCNSKPPTILVVDDEQRYLQLIRSKLIASGFQGTHADNGETALNHVSDYSPDLILLDILMPKLNGFTLARSNRLKSCARTGATTENPRGGGVRPHASLQTKV